MDAIIDWPVLIDRVGIRFHSLVKYNLFNHRHALLRINDSNSSEIPCRRSLHTNRVASLMLPLHLVSLPLLVLHLDHPPVLNVVGMYCIGYDSGGKTRRERERVLEGPADKALMSDEAVRLGFIVGGSGMLIDISSEESKA